MIIIRFRSKYFFIYQSTINAAAFLLGCLIVYLIKNRNGKDPKKKNLDLIPPSKKEEPPRGGDTKVARIVAECMKEEGFYEIVNKNIKEVIIWAMDVTWGRKELIIDLPAYIMLYLASKKIMARMGFSGIEMLFISNVKEIVQTLGSVAFGGIIMKLVMSRIIPLQLIPFITAFILYDPFLCEKEVLYIPKGKDEITYVRALPNKEDRVFVEVKDIEKYNDYKKFSQYELNSKFKVETLEELEKNHNDAKVLIEKKPYANNRNGKNYRPLSKRTKTLNDIKKGYYPCDAEDFEEVVKQMCPRDRSRIRVKYGNAWKYSDEKRD